MHHSPCVWVSHYPPTRLSWFSSFSFSSFLPFGIVLTTTLATMDLPGPSLLDRDLMAVFGSPSVSASNHQQQRQQQSQQMQRNSSVSAVGNGAGVGVAGGGGMPRSRSGPTGVPSSAGVPLLQPPTRDTPSYNRSAYNSVAAQQQQPEVAIVPHQGGAGGQVQVAPGAIVLRGGVAGGQGGGVTAGGFDQVSFVFFSN